MMEHYTTTWEMNLMLAWNANLEQLDLLVFQEFKWVRTLHFADNHFDVCEYARMYLNFLTLN